MNKMPIDYSYELKREKKKTKRKLALKILSPFIAFFLLIVVTMSTAAAPRVPDVTSYEGDNKYITFDDKCLISAHRAGRSLAPENTLSAFKACLENEGAYEVDVLEFDLHITKDGELILLHDHTLNRTSNADIALNDKKAYAYEYTLEEIRGLDMAYNFTDADGNYPYRNLTDEELTDGGYRIATLSEVLEYTENTRSDGNLTYIIEIKDGDSNGRKATDLLYATLDEMNLLDRAIVGTFNMEITEYMDEKYHDFIRSAGMGEVFSFYLDFLYNVDISKKSRGYEVLQIPYRLFGFNLGTAAFIDYAHYYGIAVQYWTINESDDITRLVDRGADCIITDNPCLADRIINA